VLPLGIIVAKRDVPREDKDAIVARPRRTTAENLRVVADAAREPAVPASSTPDPRLINLVRLLARQAARDFVQAEADKRTRDRLPG
jgi:predicted solute-binding protein